MPKQNPDKYRPASEFLVQGAINHSLGHGKYAFARKPPARRLRCSGCKKTWKFEPRLEFAPCPRCKGGRLS